MGWAGPAQPTGLDSAPNVLGRFRPKMDWADIGPKKTSIPFWVRPRRQGRARINLAQKQNGRGELFPPRSCMQNAIRSACRGKEKKNKTQE